MLSFISLPWKKAGLSDLQEGQRIEYELVEGRNGKSAAENLKIAD